MAEEKTRFFVLAILVGTVTAMAVELAIKAGTFSEGLEAFDAVIPVAAVGLAWLFSGRS